MSRGGLRFSYFVNAFRNCHLNFSWLSISDSQRYHLNLHLIFKVEDAAFFLLGKLFNFLHCICSKQSASYCCIETTIKITFFQREVIDISLFLIRQRLKGYCCESTFHFLKWRVTWNYINSHLKFPTRKKFPN